MNTYRAKFESLLNIALKLKVPMPIVSIGCGIGHTDVVAYKDQN